MEDKMYHLAEEGYADGGVPYSDKELAIMNNEEALKEKQHKEIMFAWLDAHIGKDLIYSAAMFRETFHFASPGDAGEVILEWTGW